MQRRWKPGSQACIFVIMNTECNTIDCATFTATVSTDLITQFGQDSFNPAKDLRSYCCATSRVSMIGKSHRQ